MADEAAKAPERPFTIGNRKCGCREPKGRDLIKATSMAGDMPNQISIFIALAALVTSVEGPTPGEWKKLAYDDVLDWPAVDVMLLVGNVVGNAGIPGLGI